MANRRRPEAWPGVPDGSKPKHPYTTLDSDGADWVGASGEWVEDSVRDGRRRRSALRAIPFIYLGRERGERTEDGRPFYAMGTKRLSEVADLSEGTARAVLADLSGRAASPSPMTKIADGRRGMNACYRLNAPSEFSGESMNHEIKDEGADAGEAAPMGGSISPMGGKNGIGDAATHSSGPAAATPGFVPGKCTGPAAATPEFVPGIRPNGRQEGVAASISSIREKPFNPDSHSPQATTNLYGPGGEPGAPSVRDTYPAARGDDGMEDDEVPEGWGFVR